jgi:hypothetical protein
MSRAALLRQVEQIRQALADRPVRPAPAPVTDRERARGYLHLWSYIASRWPEPDMDGGTGWCHWYASLNNPSAQQTEAFLQGIKTEWDALVARRLKPPTPEEE